MKRILTVLIGLILIVGLFVIPVSAESAASRIDTRMTVTSDGDCRVTMTVTLRLESSDSDLTFPLPLNAQDITLNNSMVSSTKTFSATEVDISRITSGVVGEMSLVFDYIIPEVVKVSPEAVKNDAEYKLMLELPVLDGFSYPVEVLDFIINLPGTVEGTNMLPTFLSTYSQNSFESKMKYLIRDSIITGSVVNALNDHDAVTMSMAVPEEMFPTVSTYIREGQPELIPILIFLALALVYWLLFLRTMPLIRDRSISPPAGVSAGEMGCHLTLAGADLTTMVFTWAQLGYILIQLDGNGRVLLHKRMDMGNERSQFEMKVYRQLFGNRRMVDATGFQYAKLVRKVAQTIPNEKNMLKSTNGNMKIFRGLLCGCQVFCGANVAANFTGNMVLMVVMSVILGIFGAITAWLIQEVAFRTHLRGKVPVYIGLVCMLIWILLGILCGQPWIPLGCVLGQWAFGYFAAYGGRRSDLGRHDAAQVLGLRRYLKHLPRGDINRLLMNEPDYFFNLAPYALAMGVIKPFAVAFGRRKMDQCPYLISRVSGKRSAEDWAHLLADTADMMDAKSRRMMVERLLNLKRR